MEASLELRAAEATTKTAATRTGVLEFLAIAVPLALIVLVIREFQLESGGFIYLSTLTLFGFVINSFLPLRYRLPFFVLLSLAGVAVVLGLTTGAWLIGIGLLLIGICHLPVAFGARVALLLIAGASLILLRVGVMPVPWSAAIWPILGSMFMFRLIIYMYDLRHGEIRPTLSSTLSYFFLLPNVVAPLFPVVDYRTFRRTYYNDEPYKIYQVGLKWMFRGVLHLILYRFVYYYLTLAPQEVQSSSDLVRFLMSNYMLYLRISGLFHIIIGMLHLFGFNLPETHHLYFLASSFTDYWRRINIYWKDFMMKVFYYPSFFRLRRLGSTTALVLATLVVFVATMLLHSYQWFWIRGSFPLAPQDALFWSVLALLVVVNAVWESKKGRKRSLKGGWSLGELPARVARTVGTFAVISVLWALWTSSSIGEWVSLLSAWDNGGVAFDKSLMPTLLVFAVTVGATVGLSPREKAKPIKRRSSLFTRFGAPIWITLSLVALYAIGNPRMYTRLGPQVGEFILSLRQPRLNARDRALLERGYYENLLGLDRFNPELWKLYAKRPSDWPDLWQTDAVSWAGDFLRLELVPSVAMDYKGKALTTNRWGMRDRDYELSKPQSTLRIALFGSSPLMGTGVADDETFEYVLEERLNLEMPGDGYASYEVLNFGVEAYSPLVQPLVLESKALDFEPDVVVFVSHETDSEKAVGHLVGLVESGNGIPYPELQAIAEKAQITAGVDRSEAIRRLAPFRDEIFEFAYGRFVAQARERGALPVWAFVPMPVEGAGACAPGRAGVCFGNLARPGEPADRTDPRVARLLQSAEAAGFVILDLSGVYQDQELKALWVAEWDHHPNAAGHKLIADGLFEQLSQDEEVLAAGRVADGP